MDRKLWYETLFENFARQYDQEPFTQGTAGECDFLEKEFNYDKSLKILDVGCGTGRHSVEMSKRGYAVTGIDLSEGQLARAREKAKNENLVIDFQQQDARDLPFHDEFDAAIMLCEGGFPLMETDEMNFSILESVTRSLKEKGKFIFTTLNGLFPLYHSVQQFVSEVPGDNSTLQRSETFDLMTFRDHSVMEIEDDSGKKSTLSCSERYYVPSEISWMLKTLGYKSICILGARLGAYSRDDQLTAEDFEMLIIAEK